MSSESSAQDYVKKSVEHREAGRLDEAMVAAKRAASLDKEDPNAWWQLALAAWERDGQASAIPHLKKTVELASGFAQGWHVLGQAYRGAAMVDKAIESWEEAVSIDADRATTWNQLEEAYRGRDKAGDADKQFEALKELERLGEVDGHQWNRLGNFYFERKQHQRAIRCYKRYASEQGGYVAYYNLGQTLNSQEVQQRADAIDAWRRAVVENSDDPDAQKRLDTWLPKALELRKRVLSGNRALLSQEEWYVAYINPFELLWLMEDGDLEELDAKAIQKAKKKLLQEIELEDGTVAWMPGLSIDRSRAIKVADELMDEKLASHHRAVAENRDLCSFLSRGDIGFFLVDEVTSPIDLLERFENDEDEFAGWLSKQFAPQFDLVLAKALESRNVNAIDALLSGRRLVLPEHEDRCFDGAQRQVGEMLEPLRILAKQSEKTKPSVEGVKAVLKQRDLGAIISLLPQYFQQVQNELAGLIRGISVDAHNHHGDTDLAKEILNIGKTLAARSPAMLHQILEDEKTLTQMLAEQSKHDASIEFRGESYSITRKAVVFGGKRIAVDDVRKLRFGIVGKHEASGRSIAFNMDVVGKDDTRVSVGWTAYKDLDKQQELFQSMQDAAFNYLMPPILGSMQSDLEAGRLIRVGPAICNKEGVRFNIEGWFSSKQIVCPWKRLNVKLDNGELILADATERKARHQIPLASTDNAFALFLLINGYQN